MAVKPGLDHLPGGKLDHHEQSGRPQQHRPAGVDRERDDHRKRRGDDRADIGHEAQQHPKDAPEPWVRDADKPQSGADQHAEARVDRCLRQEIAAKASGRIVQRHGRAPEIAGPGEPDKPVAQIFPLKQKEDDENDDDASRRQGLKQRGGDFVDQL